MAKVLHPVSGGGGISADRLRPVGSIYQSTVNADPGLLFGGTWQRYGKGRVAVGQYGADADFAVSGMGGGAKTHALTMAQMGGHSHAGIIDAATLSMAGAHTHHEYVTANQAGTGANPKAGTSTDIWSSLRGGYIGSAGSHAHSIVPAGTIGLTGGGAAHSNLMPYLTVYAWKRVA